MSNIWRPVDYDSLSSQVHEDIDVVEISSEEEDLDSFGLPASGKWKNFSILEKTRSRNFKRNIKFISFPINNQLKCIKKSKQNTYWYVALCYKL